MPGRSGARCRAAGRVFTSRRNDWRLIAGVATYTVEMLEAVPDLDTPDRSRRRRLRTCPAPVLPERRYHPLYGSSACRRVARRSCTIRGAATSSATIERADTFAEGMATRVAFSLPAQILWRRLDDFRLVSDSDIRRAILTLLERAGFWRKAPERRRWPPPTRCGDEVTGAKGRDRGVRWQPDPRESGGDAGDGAGLVTSLRDWLGFRRRESAGDIVLLIAREVTDRQRSVQGGLAEIRDPRVLDRLSTRRFRGARPGDRGAGR